MRILVVEDYIPLRTALVKGLRESGFAVDETGDGVDALWSASSTEYDAVVLDVMLPGQDGFSVLSALRSRGSTTPVLLLTAKDAVNDRIHGLDLGADDYLVKPFDFGELLARLRSLTRRTSSAKSSRMSVGDLVLDRAARSVTRAGEVVTLTAKEFAILELLALRSGEVVTRTEMWEKLYDANAETASNVVDVFIGLLRRKIEREGLPRLIHTRRGLGYVLEERT